MTTADNVEVGQAVRYTNEFRQIMTGVVVGKYRQFIMVQRPDWPSVEAIDPSKYVTFDVIENDDRGSAR